MIFGVYCIRDHLSGFQTPVLEQNDAVALRNFAQAVSDFPRQAGRSVMQFKPADFDFFRLASFDSETGKFDLLDVPQLLASGLSVAHKEDDNE